VKVARSLLRFLLHFASYIDRETDNVINFMLKIANLILMKRCQRASQTISLHELQMSTEQIILEISSTVTEGCFSKSLCDIFSMISIKTCLGSMSLCAMTKCHWYQNKVSQFDLFHVCSFNCYVFISTWNLFLQIESSITT
jgi:hypothetical protein